MMDDLADSGDDFRRNFIIVVAVHVALIAGLWLVSSRQKTPPPEQITWLDGGGLGVAAPVEEAEVVEEPETSSPLEPATPPTEPTPEPQSPPPEPIAETKPEPAKSEPTEDLDPKPTPAPTPKPTPAPTPRPKSTVTKSTPKPVKSTPRPTVTKRATPKPTTPKKTTDTAKTGPSSPKPPVTETPNGGTGSSGKPGGTTVEGNGGKGAPGGTPDGAEVTAYFSEVGETFRPIWKQYKPVTTVATGDELIARVRVRIDSSGRVESARLVRSTGNQEVDASVEKAFPEFRSVPPPPTTLLKNHYFEENMDVILRL